MVRYPNPLLSFGCGTKGQNAPDLGLGSLCSRPCPGGGTCGQWSCHCLIPIIGLTKARSGKWLTGSLNLYFRENAESNLKKKKFLVFVLKMWYYCQIFSSWHFTVAPTENENIKVCIFSMDHQADLKTKSINLPATEIFLVNFFPFIPLALLWKAEYASSTVTSHTTNAISGFL